MQDYTNTLIREEMHLADLIDRAVKQIESDKAAEVATEAYEDESDEDAFARELFTPIAEETINDDDFEDFEDFIEDDRSLDTALLESLEEDL